MVAESRAHPTKTATAARIALLAACLFISACESPVTLIDAAFTLVEERTRADAKMDTTVNLKINAAFLDQKMVFLETSPSTFTKARFS